MPAVDRPQRLAAQRAARSDLTLAAIATLSALAPSGCADAEIAPSTRAPAHFEHAAAQASDPPDLELFDPEAHGGVLLERFTVDTCRGATAHQVSIAPDRRSVAVRFFGIALEGAAGSAGCSLSLRATPPPGFRLAIKSFEVDGTLSLPAGATGVLSAGQWFIGRAETATSQRVELPGPRQGAFSAQVTADDGALRFERCGSEVFSLSLEASLSNPQGAAAAFTIERLHSLQFKLTEC